MRLPVPLFRHCTSVPFFGKKFQTHSAKTINCVICSANCFSVHFHFSSFNLQVTISIFYVLVGVPSGWVINNGLCWVRGVIIVKYSRGVGVIWSNKRKEFYWFIWSTGGSFRVAVWILEVRTGNLISPSRVYWRLWFMAVRGGKWNGIESKIHVEHVDFGTGIEYNFLLHYILRRRNFYILKF